MSEVVHGDIQAQAAAGGLVWVHTLPQPGSGLMAVVPDMIEDHANARVMDYHLGPCWCPRAKLPLEPC